MKIKQIKEHPLLSTPPEEGEWWMVSGEDRRAMQKMLARYRRHMSDELFAEMLCWMRGVDVKVEVTPADKEGLRKFLKKYKGQNYGEGVAKVHYLMRELGCGETVTDDDVKNMRNALERYRKEMVGKDFANNFVIAEGWGIAQMHYLMKELGVAEEITEDDRKNMKYRLDTDRHLKNGWLLLRLHYFMRKLGIGEEVTGDDMKIFQHQLEEGRREGHGGVYIAQMHYYMKQILPQMNKEPGTSPIPPLKDIGK